MKRVLLLMLLTGFMGSSLAAQDNRPTRFEPTDIMMLRMNTRDRVMISMGNAHQFQVQARHNQALNRGRMLHHRRMMWQQRQYRQHQMYRQASRRAAQKHIMEQRRRQINQQRKAGAPGPR